MGGFRRKEEKKIMKLYNNLKRLKRIPWGRTLDEMCWSAHYSQSIPQNALLLQLERNYTSSSQVTIVCSNIYAGFGDEQDQHAVHALWPVSCGLCIYVPLKSEFGNASLKAGGLRCWGSAGWEWQSPHAQDQLPVKEIPERSWCCLPPNEGMAGRKLPSAVPRILICWSLSRAMRN